MKRILKESGLRDINLLKKRYPKAEIYFHQDLDGVTTAIAMKKYLENNGIKVVDAHVIQYGDKEFSVKKNDAQGDTMPVLVDFAHGKPMFVIHTDHHDRQAGAEDTKSTSFRHSRSNVETISQVVSPGDLFLAKDIFLISMVDSADYAKNEITPDMVMNYIYRFDKDSGLSKNKTLLGLVTNKLLLAFKNKPGFLEELVMKCQPSLMSIFTEIKKIMGEKGFPKEFELEKNKEGYVQQMKSHPNVRIDDNIIVQYGGGSMMKPGSYDRYTPFKNNPEADFLVIAWPLGLVQASCNPFKKERELKGVNLGEIAQEVLSKWESQLKEKKVSLSTIKWISESSKGFGPESVGFTFKDFTALYGDKFKSMDGGADYLMRVRELMNKPTSDLTEEEMSLLDNIGVSAWDLIQANSGGHKCITNISGLNYLGRSSRPPQGTYKYNPESDDSPYVKFTKMVQNEFVKQLKDKINNESSNITENVDIKKYYVDKSGIHGKGSFAKNDLDENETIGILHTINQPGVSYDFTELGKMHNHSDEPNCHNVLKDKKRFLVASRPIKKGEELTTNYRLQPDLEQPEHFGLFESEEEKEMLPHIDGYRSYSPFKDLEYIIVNGNGIDCDDIVHDLILVGDNGLIKYGPKNSGAHYLDGAKKVVELPLKDNEDPQELFSSESNMMDWLNEKLNNVDINFEIRKKFFNQ